MEDKDESDYDFNPRFPPPTHSWMGADTPVLIEPVDAGAVVVGSAAAPQSLATTGDRLDKEISPTIRTLRAKRRVGRILYKILTNVAAFAVLICVQLYTQSWVYGVGATVMFWLLTIFLEAVFWNEDRHQIAFVHSYLTQAGWRPNHPYTDYYNLDSGFEQGVLSIVYAKDGRSWLVRGNQGGREALMLLLNELRRKVPEIKLDLSKVLILDVRTLHPKQKRLEQLMYGQSAWIKKGALFNPAGNEAWTEFLTAQIRKEAFISADKPAPDALFVFVGYFDETSTYTRLSTESHRFEEAKALAFERAHAHGASPGDTVAIITHWFSGHPSAALFTLPDEQKAAVRSALSGNKLVDAMQ